jgi:hypothetical protein
MPGNFFPVLTIDANGRVVPEGPLDLEAGEKVLHVYAWVFQLNEDGTGAMCVAEAPHDQAGLIATDAWTTQANTIHAGRFRTGSAVAMAVLISEGPTADEPLVYWWSETVRLEQDTPAFRGRRSRAADMSADLKRLTGLVLQQHERLARLEEQLGLAKGGA